MRSASLLLALSLSVAVLGVPPAASREPRMPAGFRALFNGKDLTGWFGRPHEDPRVAWALSPVAQALERSKHREEFEKHWKVADDALVNDGDGPYATSAEEFGDMELRLEYRTVAKADSGIYLRGNPQIQIWDTTEAGGKWNLGAQSGSGGLWNNSPGAPGKDPLVKADKPFGQWNSVRIVQVGDIPRTKSGKIVELAVREVVHGRPVKNLEALANPEALEQFRARAELAT